MFETYNADQSGGGTDSQASGSPPTELPMCECPNCNQRHLGPRPNACSRCRVRRIIDTDESPGLSGDNYLDSDSSGPKGGGFTCYKNTSEEERITPEMAAGLDSTTTSGEESQSQAGPNQDQ
jgi:hypothetical protein